MQYRSFIKWVPITALILSAVGLTGCSTTGYRKGDATAASLQTGSSTIQAESRALSLTIDSLNELVNTPAPDPRPQFKNFSRSLDQLVASAAEADEAVKDIRKRSDAYFAAWDTELSAMGFDVVRENSTLRKTAVSNQVDVICRRYEDNQAVVAPLIAYLQDIHRALSVDLTREGLDAARPIVRNADDNSRKVQSALTRLTADLMASETRISSTTVMNATGAAQGTGTRQSASEASIH